MRDEGCSTSRQGSVTCLKHRWYTEMASRTGPDDTHGVTRLNVATGHVSSGILLWAEDAALLLW